MSDSKPGKPTKPNALSVFRSPIAIISWTVLTSLMAACLGGVIGTVWTNSILSPTGPFFVNQETQISTAIPTVMSTPGATDGPVVGPTGTPVQQLTDPPLFESTRAPAITATGTPLSEGPPTSPGGTTDQPIILGFQVIDAEYDLVHDRIVMISDNPSQLHIYDPSTQADVVVDLSRPPSCVSVEPSGDFAAVGHDALISYVDLQSGQVVKVLDVTADVFDVVLAGNGWVYASPRRDQWETLRAVEIATNNEFNSTGNSIRAGTVYKLHPDGKSLYGADRGLSPSDIEKIDISDGVPVYAYDSPYHGDYAMCGDLWMSEDGKRIFTACGNVFRASSSREQDMTYNGNLSRLSHIQHLVHSAAAGRILAIPSAYRYGPDSGLEENKLVVFEYENLNTEGILTLPDFVNEEPFMAHGRFVFVNSAGNQYYVIVQADEASGLLNDYGLVIGEF